MAADPTATFFEALAKRGHESLLQNASGTLRLELRNGRRTQYWYVTIAKGDITVSHANEEADAVVRCDKALFDEMATGRANVMTAILRGVLETEGDLGLAVSFQRLFPAPPKSVYARKIR
jgi:putative sterol carrier protein